MLRVCPVSKSEGSVSGSVSKSGEVLSTKTEEESQDVDKKSGT